MATNAPPNSSSTSADSTARKRRGGPRLSKAQRYAEECKPLPAVAGETLEERVDRLDASIDYLAQCFQDEFEVRDEGNLLVDIITQVLLPFAALSTAASLLYVRLVEWSSTHFPNFERAAAGVYIALLFAILLLVLYSRWSGHFDWINALVDKGEDALGATVPERKETLTRNNYVNRWIFIWVIGAFALFIPLTFIVLRSDVADDLGVRLAIDTANICDGPGRVHLFKGSDTCVEIQEDNADSTESTHIENATGDAASNPVISPVEAAETPIDAHIAEIRLDTTTTLALAVLLLVGGVLVSMGLWWWRNRTEREIELL